MYNSNIGESMTRVLDKDKEVVVKPVVVNDKLVGWLTWKRGSHDLDLWNVNFEHLSVFSILQYNNIKITFNIFLKEVDTLINDIKQDLEGPAI